MSVVKKFQDDAVYICVEIVPMRLYNIKRDEVVVADNCPERIIFVDDHSLQNTAYVPGLTYPCKDTEYTAEVTDFGIYLHGKCTAVFRDNFTEECEFICKIRELLGNLGTQTCQATASAMYRIIKDMSDVHVPAEITKQDIKRALNLCLDKVLLTTKEYYDARSQFEGILIDVFGLQDVIIIKSLARVYPNLELSCEWKDKNSLEILATFKDSVKKLSLIKFLNVILGRDFDDDISL